MNDVTIAPGEQKKEEILSNVVTPTTASAPVTLSAKFAVVQLSKRNIAMNYVALIGIVSTLLAPYLYIVNFRIGIVFMAFIVALLVFFLGHSLILNAKMIKKYNITTADYKKVHDDGISGK